MGFDYQKNLSHHALARLQPEDLDLIVELVLHSGSLKDLAAAYGVSYPTIRARLDRLIARLKDAVAGRPPDPVSDLLATLVERGEVTVSAARSVRDLVRSLPLPPPPGPPGPLPQGGTP